jgi:hypothetical protein
MKIVVGTLVDKVNEHHIPLWLAHHSKYASLILVVDMYDKPDLSAQTYKLIAEYDCFVTKLPFKFHEGRAFKYLHGTMLNFAREDGIEWVGIVNIDEVFSNHDFINCLDGKDVCLSFPMLHFYGDYQHIRIDNWWRTAVTNVVDNIKFWKLCLDKYEFMDIEMHCPHTPIGIVEKLKDGKGRLFIDTYILHYGFIEPDAMKKRKKARGKGYAEGGDKLNFGEPLKLMEYKAGQRLNWDELYFGK